MSVMVGGGGASKTAIIDMIYPVGSIYMSVNSASPATLFGGTWEQIQDSFLLAAGSSYEAGATGGEAEHQLTTDEMPSHNHAAAGSADTDGSHTHAAPDGRTFVTTDNADVTFSRVANTYSNTGTTNMLISAPDAGIMAAGNSTGSSGGHTHNLTVTINGAGGGAAHNNMPPYLAVYMWKRTA